MSEKEILQEENEDLQEEGGNIKACKSDLVIGVSRRTGLSCYEAKEAVDAVFSLIAESIACGIDVQVTGFGLFRLKKVKSRVARNPRTGEIFMSQETYSPSFRAGTKLRKFVRVNAESFLQDGSEQAEAQDGE